MKLIDFLQQNDTCAARLAEQLETSPAVVSRYINGKRIPSPEIMRAIVSVTNGQVTANDFYDLPSLNTAPAPTQAQSCSPDKRDAHDRNQEAV